MIATFVSTGIASLFAYLWISDSPAKTDTQLERSRAGLSAWPELKQYLELRNIETVADLRRAIDEWIDLQSLVEPGDPWEVIDHNGPGGG